MRHIGFTETVATVPGLRDFVIEVEPSGLPFLVEYKEALATYREQHSALGDNTEAATKTESKGKVQRNVR
jgi:hypothetical protein